jgi:hypothetical protein
LLLYTPMSPLRLAALLFAGLVSSQESAPRGEPALESLAAVAKRLDDGIAAVIKGTKPAEAFKPWKPETVPIDRTTVLLGNMKSQGITVARTFAIELRIQLWSSGRGVYRITALAHATPEEASLISLSGQPFDGAEAAAAVPVAKCGKDAEPFRDAAESLLKRLKENKAGVPLFAGDDRVTKLVPAPFREQVLEEMRKSRAAAPRICRAVADAKYDEVRIQLDEQHYSTFGADGSTKDAFVRGKLRVSEAGEVMYRLNRLETE